MQRVIIQNQTRPLTQPLVAGYCASFASRFRGYMLKSKITPTEGLLLVEKRESRVDSAIHMFFMSFDLAVIWLNDQGTVVDTCHARRWRPVYTPKYPARFILETHPQRLSDFQPGDRVSFDHA